MCNSSNWAQFMMWHKFGSYLIPAVECWSKMADTQCRPHTIHKNICKIACLDNTIFFVVLEAVFTLVTVGDRELGHPLGTAAVSSLCVDSCYFCPSAELHLQPLVAIICLGWPRTSPTGGCSEVQPGISCSMVYTVFELRRCRDLTVWDSSVLHTQWRIACGSWKE